MGIEVKSSTVTVEINGVDYAAEIGDPDLLNRIRLFSAQMAGTDYEHAQNLYQEFSDQIHAFVVELFGKKAEDAIFAVLGGRRDIVAELKLFAELNRIINESEALMSLDRILGDFSGMATI